MSACQCGPHDYHKPIGVLGCLHCGHWIGEELMHDTSDIIWAASA